jgi:hypothetical protein
MGNSNHCARFELLPFPPASSPKLAKLAFVFGGENELHSGGQRQPAFACVSKSSVNQWSKSASTSAAVAETEAAGGFRP